MTDYSNLSVVLNLLAGATGVYLVGKLFSYLAENWAKWHTFSTQVKFIVPMIVSGVISIGSTLLLKQTEFLATISPYYTTLASFVIMYLGTQKGYIEAKASGYGKTAKHIAITK
jgi:hypothetical protein